MKCSIVLTCLLLLLTKDTNTAPLNFGFFDIEELIDSLTEDSTNVFDELIDFLEDLFCDDSNKETSERPLKMKPTTLKAPAKDMKTSRPTQTPTKDEPNLQAVNKNVKIASTLSPQKPENDVKLNNDRRQNEEIKMPPRIEKQEDKTTAKKPESTTSLPQNKVEITTTTKPAENLTTQTTKAVEIVTAQPVKAPDNLTTQTTKAMEIITAHPVKAPENLTTPTTKAVDIVTAQPVKAPDNLTTQTTKAVEIVTAQPGKAADNLTTQTTKAVEIITAQPVKPPENLTQQTVQAETTKQTSETLTTSTPAAAVTTPKTG